MPSFTHHIFVCGNVREPGHKRGCCDPEGTQTLREAFKKELKAAGSARGRAPTTPAASTSASTGQPWSSIRPESGMVGSRSPTCRESSPARSLAARSLSDLLIPDDCLNNPGCPHRGGKPRSESRG